MILRHTRNLALALLAKEDADIRGTVVYSRRLMLRVSAAELYAFSLFFILLAVALNSWFCLGGGFACALSGFQHARLARRFPQPAALDLA